MSTPFRNPAVDAFAASFGPEKVLAQVLIQRLGSGFDLRNVADRNVPQLRIVPVSGLRALAQVTEEGDFRPLKSAPTLQRGWRAQAGTAVELELALNSLYPGAIADWFALRNGRAHVTNYREFTNRQTGMYRITQMLTDAQAAQTISTCCDARFCLKRRCWTVEFLLADGEREKSDIPCLEPCAILMESARKTVRIEQADKTGQK
jgi:hypothetical protein